MLKSCHWASGLEALRPTAGIYGRPAAPPQMSGEGVRRAAAKRLALTRADDRYVYVLVSPGTGIDLHTTDDDKIFMYNRMFNLFYRTGSGAYHNPTAPGHCLIEYTNPDTGGSSTFKGEVHLYNRPGRSSGVNVDQKLDADGTWRAYTGQEPDDVRPEDYSITSEHFPAIFLPVLRILSAQSPGLDAGGGPVTSGVESVFNARSQATVPPRMTELALARYNHYDFTIDQLAALHHTFGVGHPDIRPETLSSVFQRHSINLRAAFTDKAA